MASTDDLASRAYRWLAQRDRSRAEMRAYLLHYCDDAAAIEHLLDALEQRGYLSEVRLAEQVIRSRRSRAGSTRIRQELNRRGIQPDVIAESTRTLENGDANVAAALWKKRFSAPAKNRSERERQLRFLLNRGFSHATALKVLRSTASTDTLAEEACDDQGAAPNT